MADFKKEMIGIRNTSNYCFLNSSIQFLHRSEAGNLFVEHLCEKSDCVASMLGHVMRGLRQCKNSYITLESEVIRKLAFTTEQADISEQLLIWMNDEHFKEIMRTLEHDATFLVCP